MLKLPAFDLSRLPQLPSLDALRAKLPPMPAPGAPRADLAPALRDMLARLADLKPGAPACEMGPRRGVAAEVAVPEGARFDEHTHRGSQGALGYRLYVPSAYAGRPMPLVVMLHGCTQSPEDFAAGTRMNEVAEEHGFLVAYPRQTRSANAQKCWNWFDAAGQIRDRGEPALIAGLTRDVMREFAVDPGRVYVAGLSAGGAAAAILAQLYPDLYAAAGVHSGLAAGAARDMPGAFAAMRGGGREGPGRAMPTIVFHGDADPTVAPVNGDQVIVQARGGATLAAEATRGRSEGGLGYTRRVESDAAGLPMTEHWLLHGAGHAWSGGSAAGSYTEPRGPDASREMLRFFLRHRLAA
ncbi:extracellular catalytic domain type 1 short-chain-length polyhydroxyalkanoate depolymerase [Lichenibacterium dinghuense]|uniref:extracellular catalytic domain type 1 short-chain-length polyhydroxyalkanoate depolymerase n=1 Tax=Lichenibacterium dinghuense TaxID=2895977 RepID=UPI001F1EDA25|nr:PHB depolymerase family esterase [Lichenibacterium sp. 6Y81]